MRGPGGLGSRIKLWHLVVINLILLVLFIIALKTHQP